MNKSNDRGDQGKLLLISMPFSMSIFPSIQLGTLCSFLKSKGIPVNVNHAYLKCSDILNPELYHLISYGMRDEIFYPFFLFPENFQRYKDKIKDYFNGFIKHHPIPLETVLDRLNSFNKELFAKIDFSKYSLIGFSVTYDQLKASIFLTKKIKQLYPNIQIVFGGAYCTKDLGISLLKTFPEIDFIVSGEGEETLTTLFLNLNKGRFDKIKGLGWRDNNGTVNFNGPPGKLPLDSLPIPEYEDYFKTLEECSSNTKEYIMNHLSIPIEGSRGCWWNKCTFCNLNAQYSHYREKSIERIIYEVKEQVDRYHCHSIRFMDNVQKIKNFNKLMFEIKNMNKDLDIFLEIRAGHLKKEDYQLMRDAGVRRVNIGVEAFGNKMLKKMNKGVTTIENIAAIKYCQEFGILAFYNIIINYSNEDQSDFQEIIENLKFLKGFIPPVSVHPMSLYHGSPVYNDPEIFNIKEIKLKEDALWRFPQKIWETLVPFFYDYTCINERKDRTTLWQEIFNPWKQAGMERIFAPLLFYHDTGDFMVIRDKLSGKSVKKILKGVERELYLFCDSIQTKSAILKKFSNLSPDYLEGLLEKWIANRWMFREGEKFISLAVRISSMMSSISYLSDFRGLSKSWSVPPPSPYWKTRLKLGSIADMNLSINLNKKPVWLRQLKKIVTFKMR